MPARITLPVAGPPYDDDSAEASSRPPLRSASHPGPDPWPGPPQQPGGADGWAGQFAQALAEALAGSRPARQMTPWTTEQARRRIRRLGAELGAAQRPVVRRVLTSAPCSDVVEMTVIIGIGPRTRAIAARLERAGSDQGRSGRDTRWVCTAVEAA
jgi:hypothetical protein